MNYLHAVTWTFNETIFKVLKSFWPRKNYAKPSTQILFFLTHLCLNSCRISELFAANNLCQFVHGSRRHSLIAAEVAVRHLLLPDELQLVDSVVVDFDVLEITFKTWREKVCWLLLFVNFLTQFNYILFAFLNCVILIILKSKLKIN